MSGMITPDGTCTVCGKTNVAPNHPFELPQSVTAPTPDAVAQAREGVWGALEDWQNTTRTTAQVHRDVDAALDAYAAAVRAECAAKVRALSHVESDGTHGEFPEYLYRDEVLAALEAQP